MLKNQITDPAFDLEDLVGTRPSEDEFNKFFALDSKKGRSRAAAQNIYYDFRSKEEVPAPRAAESDRHIKPFEKKQTPAAVVSLVLVIALFSSILAFGQTPVMETAENIVHKGTVSSKGKASASEHVKVPENNDAYAIESSIIVQRDRAMEIYSVNQDVLEGYGKEINDFARHVRRANVYVLLAPTAIEFYGPDDYKTENHSFLTAMKYVYGELDARNVKGINARDTLAKHVDDYIYFRTDHHWTALGAYYAYRTFCEASGQKATQLEKHRSGQIDGFVGSMYRYTNSQTLKNNPDYVKYYYPITSAKGHVYNDASMTEKNPRSVKVINTNVSADNAYLAFVEGDNPIEKFDTGVKNGKSIVLIKESFGDTFAPFLMDNYETVYVVDPRKVEFSLEDFVKDNKIDDVLFLNYAFAPANPTYKAALAKMLS